MGEQDGHASAPYSFSTGSESTPTGARDNAARRHGGQEVDFLTKGLNRILGNSPTFAGHQARVQQGHPSAQPCSRSHTMMRQRERNVRNSSQSWGPQTSPGHPGSRYNYGQFFNNLWESAGNSTARPVPQQSERFLSSTILRNNTAAHSMHLQSSSEHKLRQEGSRNSLCALESITQGNVCSVLRTFGLMHGLMVSY